MTLLLGFLAFIALLVMQMFMSEEDATPRQPLCPSCSQRRLRELDDRGARYLTCTFCGKNWKYSPDGRLVRADP